MSKRSLSCFLLLVLMGYMIHAQDQAETEVQESIVRFFEGFHQQDSTVIKSVVADGIKLQTMGVDKEGNNRMRTDPFEGFLKSIASIPDSIQFREELHAFKIQVDGPMAHAWTPYTFWVNGEISHCGVNSFQLFNDGTMWRIIYLVDTRRREGCAEKMNE